MATNAERIIQSITHPEQQARALIDLAETVGLPMACRLLGEAFAVGSLSIPLPVAAKLARR